ncbi:hypothetical protein IG631_19121 [Alternaria alternata]|nr:hypothetical protein IG631_19121 [Alternaria alternata]
MSSSFRRWHKQWVNGSKCLSYQVLLREESWVSNKLFYLLFTILFEILLNATLEATPLCLSELSQHRLGFTSWLIVVKSSPSEKSSMKDLVGKSFLRIDRILLKVRGSAKANICSFFTCGRIAAATRKRATSSTSTNHSSQQSVVLLSTSGETAYAEGRISCVRFFPRKGQESNQHSSGNPDLLDRELFLK